MRMPALLHDGNLLPDLVLCAAERIGEGEMRSGGDGAFAKLSHPIYSMVLTFDGLDSLQSNMGKRRGKKKEWRARYIWL